MLVKVFLDTNVLLDVLVEGRPGTPYSRQIFQAVRSGKLEAVLTVQSIIDARFIARKYAGFDDGRFRESIRRMLNYINIEPLDSFDLRAALDRPDPDFEDNVQWAHADAVCCDFFVSSDKALFARKQSDTLSCISPEEFVLRMRA